MKSSVKTLAETLLARYRSRLHGDYGTFAEAQRVIGGTGYEAASVTEIVEAKTRALKDKIDSSGSTGETDEVSLLMMLAILRAAATRKTVRVLDFGGACGAHFLVARGLAPINVDLHWAVVETSAMADAGRRLTSSGIDFFETIPQAVSALGAVDVVFANNSVQYTPDPGRCLGELMRVDAEAVCVCKVPAGGNSDLFFTVQTSRVADNGPGPSPAGFAQHDVSYPLAIFPRVDAFRVIEPGYRVLARHVHGATLYHPRSGLVRYQSVLAGKQESC